MAEKKVSIVIPVYNVEAYLRTCLNSICRQTLEGIEAIVVNDGSTDGSAEILAEYEENYPELFRIFHIENHGVSYARNFGVEQAVGEYILFVDSDDFIESNMCELLYKKAAEDDDDVVLCRYMDVRERPLTKRLTRKRSKAYQVAYETDFSLHERRFELTHISPFPWDKLFKKSLIEKFPFPQGLRFEDLAIMYPVLCSAGRVGVLQNRLYNYRRASSGSFLNQLSEKTLDIISSLTLMVDSLKANGHFTEFYDEIEYICIRHLLERLNTIFDDRRKSVVDPKNRGMLELKKKIVTQSMDFLEKNFKNWQENRYLKYSASANSRRMLRLYRSKKRMLLRLSVRERMPLPLVRARVKMGKFFAAKKEDWLKFKKRKHKLRYLKEKITLFKLFSLPRDVEYTRYYQKFPVSERDVLFESKHGEDVAGNVFHMLLAMRKEQFAHLNVCLTLKEELIEYWQDMFARYGIDFVKIIPYNTKEYLMALATAKYLITDTSLPSYYIKRKEQVYLNTWHGTPLKAMGRRVPQREYALGNVQRNFYIADYLLYQNAFSRDVFLDDYMLREIYNGKVMLSGYPRNSAFFETERYEIIRDELGISDMQVMAYMPTWRGLLNKKENKKQIEEISGYLYELDEALEEGQLLYVKLHPYVREGLNYDDFEHIRPFPEQYETYDFLNATDLLITDYSSIMFDYAVSGKKIILFTYDREEYLKDRGMYVDLDTFEFPQADTVDALVEKINDDTPAAYENFRKTYCAHDTKDTALKVCECLFLGSKPDFSVESVQHNGRKNVLVLINGLARDEGTTKRIRRYNRFDLENYNFYYCMKSSNVKAATRKLSLFRPQIGYLPLMFDVNYTVKSRIACMFAFWLNLYSRWTDRQIDRLAEIEKEKYFGNLHFDYVVNISNRDRLMHHICGQFDVPKVYNFLSYQEILYKKKRTYRKNVKYVLKHMDLYDYVLGKEEVKELPCPALRQNRVKFLLAEKGKFEMDRILEEVKNACGQES